MKNLARELEKLWAIEKIKVRQRARDWNILQGDRNTTYFHTIANHRARKKKIEGLQGEKGLVQDTQGILNIAVRYYRNMFKWESREPFCLNKNFWDPEDLVLPDERDEMEAPFSEDEIRDVVFNCYNEGGPGPNGLSFLFLPQVLGYCKRRYHEYV
jgi:hypothetical protein